MSDNRGLLQVLKIDALVLFGGTALLILLCMLPGQRDAGTFMGLMIFFNLAGVIGNFVAMVVFAILRQWPRCLGAIIGAVLFAMVGFGLCLGGLALLEEVGVKPFNLH